MLLTRRDDKFIAMTRYEERGIPKEAGFRWDPGEVHWYTKDPMVAAKLYGYADPTCKAELQALSKKYDASVEASKARDANIIIPSPTGLSYMPFQKAGIQFAAQRQGTLIGDDMGLGKTVQVLGLINLINDIKTGLIICPNSLKISWKQHCDAWLTRPMSFDMAMPKFFPDTDIVIINYDLLKRYHQKIRERKWDLVAVDESHFIKNPKAQRTIEITGKRKKNIWEVSPITGAYRIGCTGTPILNGRPIELFPVLNWLDPETYDNFFRFGFRYANGHKDRSGWDFSGYSNLAELQKKLRSTVMIRRTKQEVLTELPPKVRQVIEMPVPGEDLAELLKEREVYEKCIEEMHKLKEAAELAKISDNIEEYENAVTALKAAQTYAFNEIARVRHETALIKMPILARHLKEMMEGNDQKIAIFCHHHDMVQGLLSEFGEGMCAILTGKQNIDERNEAIQRFVNDVNCKLFIGTTAAAGTGINGLQKVCSHAIIAEEEWVPALITQAEDRLNRFGQVWSVLVQHYVLTGSIDATMAKRTVHKQNIADRALDKGLEIGRSLTLEDLNPALGGATEDVTPDQLTIDAQKLTMPQVQNIHKTLQMIAGLCDGARAVDGMGFNKFDARLGRSLAEQPKLTAKAAALGRKIALKYHKQLPEELIDSFKELAA